MLEQGPNLAEKQALDQLRKILLKPEREEIARVSQKLQDPTETAKRMEPIILDHIDKLKEEFPEAYHIAVKSIVKKQLSESQTEILNAIYPVMGTMIMKYTTLQFQKLKEGIDSQIKNTFSNSGILGSLKSRIFSSKTTEEILSKADHYVIDEVFVVERNSGLLIGAASLEPTVNRDMIAGMLTAIKSFVEDAFMQGQEDLDLIQYDTHKLLIQNFPSYFVVVAISGSISSGEKSDLTRKILAFAGDILTHKVIRWNEEDFAFISKQLDLQFFDQTTHKSNDQ